MARRPTIADIARVSGVSVATVDRVLNRRHPVREETAQRVMLAAEEIGYHAASLIRRRIAESLPARTFTFLLQKGAQQFYRDLGAALAEETGRAAQIKGTAIVEYTEEVVPSVIAANLRRAGETSDAVVVVGVDHPHVNAAVDDLAAAGVPVFTLLSDLSTPARAGHFGVDNRKAGRTAGWAISRLARTPGKVGILIGSHRYTNQEVAEISFRAFFRENAPEFTLLEPLLSLDTRRLAYEATVELLSANDDLAGIYLAGGGMEGMIAALRDEGAGRRIVAVCNELIPETRAALLDKVLDLAIATPVKALAREAIAVMAEHVVGRRSDGLREVILPADLYISENV